MAGDNPTLGDSPSPTRSVNGDGAPRLRRRLAVERPGKVLWIVAVVSLALHVALAATTYHRAIGTVDPSMLDAPHRPLRVRQARFDTGYDPLARPERAEAQTDAGPSLAEVSASLLAEADAAPAEAPIEQEVEQELRDYDEPMPEPEVDAFAETMPAFAMADDVWQAMVSETPEALRYQSDDDDVAGAGATGDGDMAGGGGAGEAQRMLAGGGVPDVGLESTRFDGEGGGAGGGGGLAMPDASGPSVEAGTALDDQLLEMPLLGPELDFAGMALEDTTRLHVPEHLDHDFAYYVTRFDGDAADRGYFRVDIVPRQSLRRLQTMSKDVIFLLDLSSTTAQRWAGELAGGIRQSLSTLHRDDRFNIVLLADQIAFFSGGGPLEATQEHLEEAREFLDQIESARQPLSRISGARSAERFRQRLLYHIPEGRADLEAALSRLLVRDADAERVYNLVLISEGRPTDGVIEPRELINLITRDNAGLASIYAVGIGSDVDRTLLEFLAYRNRGYCLYVDRRGASAGKIRELASRIRYPLVRGLRVHVAGSQLDEVYPMLLPNVHQGERLSVYGRYDAPEAFTMRVTGRNMGKPVDFTFARNLALAPQADGQVRRDWAFWKLHHLYSEILRDGETGELLEQVNRLRRQYDLQTLY